MEYRSHMIGGTLKLSPGPTNGTIVSCSFRRIRPSSLSSFTAQETAAV